MAGLHPDKPCNECPWRTDVAPGRFEVERFRALATTAYDRSPVLFQCHKTSDERPKVCAGFLLRGAFHNIGARLATARGEVGAVEDAGYPLFETYRAMAVANGVSADDPVLADCRDAGYSSGDAR